MAQAFVSYRSDDRGAVDEIVRGLQAEDIDVWWDQGITPTGDWRTEIHEKLLNAKAAIVIWSRASVDPRSGKWVIQEAEEADGLGTLVPVCIDDVLPPLGLRHVQALDLIDWRGDRSDPRWIAFVEVVRAKIEGRAIDVGIARPTVNPSIGALLRGRSAQVLLAVGLAALIVTSGIAFGFVLALGLVAGLAVAYLVLNMLFSRRRGDRGGALLIRRAFAVGWVTVVANVVVWTAAVGAGAWPFAEQRLYADMSISVFDELRTPVPDALVTVVDRGRAYRVVLNANGVGRYRYPLYWGAENLTVVASREEHRSEQLVSREGGRFGDAVLGVASGVERLRVSHVTLQELAIDAVIQGNLPPELASVFPNVAGVVRNEVWNEVNAFLDVFDPLGSFSYDGVAVMRENGDITDTTDADYGPPAPWLAHLRFPNETEAGDQNLEFAQAFDFSNGVFGCAFDQALGPEYFLEVGDNDIYYEVDRFAPSPQATARLQQLGLDDNRDSSGAVYGQLRRLVTQDWLAQVLDDQGSRSLRESLDRAYAATAEDDEEYQPTTENRFARFLARRGFPSGVMVASVKIATTLPDGCGGDAHALVRIILPRPELRVSIVQNVSSEPLPIGAIIQGVDVRDDVEFWTAGSAGEERQSVDWPGRQLAPGQSIIVPRRLLLQGDMTPTETAEIQQQPSSRSQPLYFRVLPEAPFEPFDATRDDVVARWYFDRFAHQARGLTISGDRIIGAHEGVWDTSEESARYVVGPSVERLSVMISGVQFDLRDDTGQTLAMIGSCACGSCPFVWASSPGRPTMLNHGTIITDLIGSRAEAADRIYLGRAVDRVEIREIEPEISQLDQVRLIVRSADGRERSHLPSEQRLRARDGVRAIMRQGDVMALDFPGYAPREDDVAVFLEAYGYYDPVRASPRDILAMRAAMPSR